MLDESVEKACIDHRTSSVDEMTVFRDAITITVDRITFSRNSKPIKDIAYFVYYRFIGDEITDTQTCNDKGEIVFQHKGSFPIVSSNDESIGKVISNIPDQCIRFVVFSGCGDSKFGILGEAHVELRDLLEIGELSAQLVSPQATVIGTISILCRLHNP
jgi:hypothetical protein